jgi:hypothetical protein
MNRRNFLVTAVAGATGSIAGCVAGGRVVHEQHRSVRIDAGRGWIFEITDVEGDGAVSYTVRADRRFDVYYFTSDRTCDRYRSFLGGSDPPETPTGHDDLGRAAVYDERREEFEAAAPADGGRRSVSVDGSHYFVVDHSNYGMGVPVEEHADPLDAFVDLTVYNETLPV